MENIGRKLPGCIEVNKYRLVRVSKQIIKGGKCLFLCLNLQNIKSKNAGQFSIDCCRSEKVQFNRFEGKHGLALLIILKALVLRYLKH